MALLVDGDVSRIDDLKTQDTGVLDVANGEGIGLTGKLKLGEQEMRVEIDRFLRLQTGGTQVLGLGSVQYAGQAVSLGQVVVSESMQLWHVLKTLEAVYRDAYFSQLNDRYEQKWKHYLGLAEQQRRYYFNADGVQIVANPVNRPRSLEATVTGGNLPAATYYIQATFLDAQGRESAPSPLSAASSLVPNALTVAVSEAPANVVAWNVYVGLSEESITLQNAEPIAASDAWRLPATGLVAGRGPGNGQVADATILRSTRNRRG